MSRKISPQDFVRNQFQRGITKPKEIFINCQKKGIRNHRGEPVSRSGVHFWIGKLRQEQVLGDPQEQKQPKRTYQKTGRFSKNYRRKKPFDLEAEPLTTARCAVLFFKRQEEAVKVCEKWVD